MGIVKVLEIIGDDNIKYQNLNNSLVRAKVNRKHNDTEITFCTDVDFLNDDSKVVGLVVWVDADKLQSAVKAVSKGE